MAICVIGLLVCHNSFGNSFHYDDSHSLVDNPHLRSLGNTLRFFYDPGTFSAIRKAARLEPGQSESYLNIGRVSLSLGRVAEALTALERATELEPDRHLSWGLLAQAHVDADDLAAAIKACEKAIWQAPENSEYYNNVGLLYLREGFLEEARRMYEPPWSENPRSRRGSIWTICFWKGTASERRRAHTRRRWT